ncbi:MAG: DinB family protein [Bryobacterales bacterium]
MSYRFLVDTYETERIKVLSVWSMFRDQDLPFRPHPSDNRGRSVHEHMVHQCVSENLWFVSILGIEVGAAPLPETETRLEFIRRYAELSSKRADALRAKDDAWWEETVRFFDVPRSRAWVMVRRIAHTAHHRGQQTALLRMLNADLHSTYGPTADTGGLMQNHAPVIYAYPDIDARLEAEAASGVKASLPGPGGEPPTERPSSHDLQDR